MTYVNVGAYVDGVRPRTKKALREALAVSPADVRFDQTSALAAGKISSCDLRGDAVPPGYRLAVVGPDPYTHRRWYAVVEIIDGRVEVS